MWINLEELVLELEHFVYVNIQIPYFSPLRSYLIRQRQIMDIYEP